MLRRTCLVRPRILILACMPTAGLQYTFILNDLFLEACTCPVSACAAHFLIFSERTFFCNSNLNRASRSTNDAVRWLEAAFFLLMRQIGTRLSPLQFPVS